MNTEQRCIVPIWKNGKKEQQLKPVPEIKAVSVAEPIISESFFFLTSSNFSRDRSKGFIPTIYTDSKVPK